MGCGQSKIAGIYPKNKKNKSNGSKKNVNAVNANAENADSTRSASVEQKNGNGTVKGSKTHDNGVEVNGNEEQNGSIEVRGQTKKKPAAPGSGPLLQQTSPSFREISTSQLDFFRMLDEKIENGPDYDESLDTATRAERVSSLLRRWELASATWSNVTETSDNSVDSGGGSPCERRSNTSTLKDREGMRNIVGGRPESAPIFARNANRVDGLRESSHPCSSPSMPRHVLESITQSPTQSLKNATPPTLTPPTLTPTASPPTVNRATSEFAKVHHCAPARDPVNGEYIARQALYREQYLRQTGIVAIPARYPATSTSGDPLAGNPYVRHFQIANSQRFANAPANATTRKRLFDAAQTT